jgi:hypothetical protein
MTKRINWNYFVKSEESSEDGDEEYLEDDNEQSMKERNCKVVNRVVLR